MPTPRKRKKIQDIVPPSEVGSHTVDAPKGAVTDNPETRIESPRPRKNLETPSDLEKRSIRNITFNRNRTEAEITEPEPYAAAEKHTTRKPKALGPKTDKISHSFRSSGSTIEHKATSTHFKPIEPAFETWEDEEVQNTKKSIWKIAAAIIVILIIGVFVSDLFVKARVTIVGTDKVLHLDGDSFALVLAGNDSSSTLADTAQTTGSGSTSLPIVYKTVEFTVNASSSTDLSGEQKVTSKATGQVIIYNKTGSAQKLIATTRLQTPSGLIYRLVTGVNVPAETTSNGKVTAGSVTADIAADQAGPSYNGPAADFVFPGFQGISKYTTIYARSSTPLTGGNSGTVAVPSSDDLSASKGTLEDDLKTSALEKITVSVPAGYVYIPDLMIMKESDVTTAPSATNASSTSVESADVTAYFLDENSFSKAIAFTDSEFQSATSTLNYFAATTTSLTATISVGADGSNPTVYFTGSADVKALFEPLLVASNISHLSKQQALNVVENMPGVESATISLWPWWITTLPGADKVDVQSK